MGSLFSSNENNSCGIDSIPSVDRIITDLVFVPPKVFSKENIMSYFNALEECTLLYITSKKGSNISTIEITPIKNKYPNKLIIYSHGNAEDIYLSYEFYNSLSNMLGIKVVGYDYNGYGLTEGVPSEEGCYDALDGIVYENHDFRDQWIVNQKLLFRNITKSGALSTIHGHNIRIEGTHQLH
jgi:hypothetical protein